jgi:hypothetical protein
MSITERPVDRSVSLRHRFPKLRSWDQSANPDRTPAQAFAGVRSPFVPLGLVATQQILHRSGANQWFSFPFHVLALVWLAFVVRAARHTLTRFGGWIAVVGGSLNGLVVAATNGMMPLDPNAWERAYGGPIVNKERMHVAVTHGWRHFFGDRFAIPSFDMVISAGDILLAIGATIALVGLLAARRTHRYHPLRRTL